MFDNQKPKQLELKSGLLCGVVYLNNKPAIVNVDRSNLKYKILHDLLLVSLPQEVVRNDLSQNSPELLNLTTNLHNNNLTTPLDDNLQEADVLNNAYIENDIYAVLSCITGKAEMLNNVKYTRPQEKGLRGINIISKKKQSNYSDDQEEGFSITNGKVVIEQLINEIQKLYKDDNYVKHILDIIESKNVDLIKKELENMQSFFKKPHFTNNISKINGFYCDLYSVKDNNNTKQDIYQVSVGTKKHHFTFSFDEIIPPLYKEYIRCKKEIDGVQYYYFIDTVRGLIIRSKVEDIMHPNNLASNKITVYFDNYEISNAKIIKKTDFVNKNNNQSSQFCLNFKITEDKPGYKQQVCNFYFPVDGNVNKLKVYPNYFTDVAVVQQRVEKKQMKKEIQEFVRDIKDQINQFTKDFKNSDGNDIKLDQLFKKIDDFKSYLKTNTGFDDKNHPIYFFLDKLENMYKNITFITRQFKLFYFIHDKQKKCDSPEFIKNCEHILLSGKNNLFDSYNFNDVIDQLDKFKLKKENKEHMDFVNTQMIDYINQLNEESQRFLDQIPEYNSNKNKNDNIQKFFYKTSQDYSNSDNFIKTIKNNINIIKNYLDNNPFVNLNDEEKRRFKEKIDFINKYNVAPVISSKELSILSAMPAFQTLHLLSIKPCLFVPYLQNQFSSKDVNEDKFKRFLNQRNDDIKMENNIKTKCTFFKKNDRFSEKILSSNQEHFIIHDDIFINPSKMADYNDSVINNKDDKNKCLVDFLTNDNNISKEINDQAQQEEDTMIDLLDEDNNEEKDNDEKKEDNEEELTQEEIKDQIKTVNARINQQEQNCIEYYKDKLRELADKNIMQIIWNSIVHFFTGKDEYRNEYEEAASYLMNNNFKTITDDSPILEDAFRLIKDAEDNLDISHPLSKTLNRARMFNNYIKYEKPKAKIQNGQPGQELGDTKGNEIEK